MAGVGIATRGMGPVQGAELLEQVTDRESFFAFVQALIDDWQDEVLKERAHPSSPFGPGANGWENGTIDSYLDAALRWAMDSEMGTSQGLRMGHHGEHSPSFSTVARFTSDARRATCLPWLRGESL